MASSGHLRKSYGGALDFEAPRMSWMEDLSPLSPKSDGAALLAEEEARMGQHSGNIRWKLMENDGIWPLERSLHLHLGHLTGIFMARRTPSHPACIQSSDTPGAEAIWARLRPSFCLEMQKA